MDNTMNTPTLSEFCNSLVLLAKLEAKIKKMPMDQDFIEKVKLWSAGIFRIVVMGEIKKGKSSFINALLGVKNLVPVNSDIATSTIYKICYGSKISYKVFFTKASNKPVLEIPVSELEKYGTENGNPDNEKEVEFIQVFVPSPFLKNGLVIIDTPGLGGLFKQHKRITYEYVPRSDAVFMVSDSVDSPIGQAELELLKDLKKITDQIYFVQTKAMVVDTDTRKSMEKNNRNILLTRGGIPADKLRYFAVDAHLKHEADENKDPEDLKDSGFIQLTRFINNEIIPNTRRTIMKNALLVALPKYDWVKDHILQTEKIYNADAQEKLTSIKEGLTKAENDLRQWQSCLPKLQDKFQDGIRQLKEDAQNYLKNYRPYGPWHMELEQKIHDAPDITALLEYINKIADQLPDFFAKLEYEVCDEMQTELVQLMKRLADDNISINSVSVNHSPEKNDVFANTAGLKRAGEQNAPKGVLDFNNLRNGMYGGLAGGTMASFVGGIIGSIVPGLGTAIGAATGYLIGSVFGAQKSWKLKKEQDLERAKNQAAAGLNKAVSTAYQSVSDNIQKILNDVQDKTVKSLKEALASRRDELTARREKIVERQMISAKDLREERKELDQWKKEFAVATRIIEAVR